MSATRPCRRCGGSGREPDPVAQGREMRAARVRREIGVRELARRVPCSPAYITDLEYGRRVMQGPKAKRAMKILGLLTPDRS